MRVVVVGAGIVGASAAFHLVEAGVETVVVDRGHVGKATLAGAGIVCPWPTSATDPDFVALYCAGAELTANYPLSVIVDGVGLNITVVSYKDRVDFGIVGDREQIDDAWSFLEGAAHALQELESLKDSG